jgi:hypothetical protein
VITETVSGGGPGREGSVLFEERHFAWPEKPGNPVREAKLPWFWFTDRREALAYVGLCAAVHLMWVALVVSHWVLHNDTLWLVLAWPATFVWLAYLRLWIDLCKRVRPRLPRHHWFMAGYANPRVRHCVQLALEEISDR